MRKRVWLPVLMIFFAATLLSQTFTIQGIVYDQTGAVIPGATVIVRHLTGGQQWQMMTDEGGRFAFTVIPAGEINVEASLPGFRTWSFTTTIGSKSVEQLIAVLEVGQVAEQVSVQAGLPSLNTRTAGAASQRAGRDGVVNRRRLRMNTESYSHIDENPFITVADDSRSTFAIDVDTASYANVRRFLNNRMMPPPDAVRIEEMINYFVYEYPAPPAGEAIAVHAEVGAAPWEAQHRLVRIALRAADIAPETRQAANLVFLIDVSGSMQNEAKLPLVKRALTLLVEQLKPADRVAIVVYAGTSGLVLPSTSGDNRNAIHAAIESLHAGGSTNGGQGIELAYRIAAENFVPDGINRVILATDGDFNVGITNEGDLIRLIQKRAESGISLSVLGFGIGNYKDSTMEKLADKGHGNYAYIDTFNEAKKVLVEQLSGTLLTVAKDVKTSDRIQSSGSSGISPDRLREPAS
jgi:Ca-activated chloride channel homolog